MPLPKPTPISVSELNRKAKSLLENHLGEVCVEAEICDLSKPNSGHWYFTLKDGRSQLRCAMFRRANLSVKFQPKVGDSAIVRGLLSIYEARGDYQLIVDHMEASGDGALQRQVDALKQKLQAEGLFDPASKLPIPEHCERIGVVTSPTGAAIEDIIQTAEKSGTKIVLVSHDLGQARRLANEIIFMHRGRVIEQTPAHEFFESPNSQQGRDFLAGVLVL